MKGSGQSRMTVTLRDPSKTAPPGTSAHPLGRSNMGGNPRAHSARQKGGPSGLDPSIALFRKSTVAWSPGPRALRGFRGGLQDRQHEPGLEQRRLVLEDRHDDGYVRGRERHDDTAGQSTAAPAQPPAPVEGRVLRTKRARVSAIGPVEHRAATVAEPTTVKLRARVVQLSTTMCVFSTRSRSRSCSKARLGSIVCAAET